MPAARKSEEAPELPNFEIPRPVQGPALFHPHSERTAPALWVRKLSVWRHWLPIENRELRTMELHRGLNILWARSSNEDPDSPRIGGHGAGKTTFCRLLRFLLDEKQSGTSEFRQDFRRSYEDGWVLGEVIIEGQPWLVGKTLGDRAGRHHFAIPDADLSYSFEERPPRGGYPDYQAALEKAALGNMQLRQLSGSGKTLEWRNLLTWLSRDQEAHYAGLLTWRDSSSESESPDLSAADRENLVRLVLGLVESKEQDLLRRRAKIASDHEEELKNRTALVFVRDRARAKLEAVLEKPLAAIQGGPTDSADDPILEAEVNNRSLLLVKEATMAITEAKLEEETSKAANEVVARTSSVQIQTSAYTTLKNTLEALEDELEPKSTPAKPKPTATDIQTELDKTLVRLLPFQGYCSQPKPLARLKKCPLFMEITPDPVLLEATVKQERRDDSKEARLRQDIAQTKARLADQLIAKTTAEEALAAAKAYALKVKLFVEAETKRLSEPAARADKMAEALLSYQTAAKECETLTSTLEEWDKQKTNLDGQIEKLSETHRQVVSEFAELFDHLAKGLVGDKVKGTIRLAGKGIQPDLHYHGRRKSAALDLAKLLAFDLSCLALGMTSPAAHHPRFILHDSPRESDLSIGIYHGLFRMARMLETACEGEPAFQYIVTTTEAPPEELKKAPWLLDPVLDSNEAASRFLGEDLAV